ncbi:GNAT family N-acetyltransferase [Robiginitalea sp. SC105]|uniref:GNAT family N-acetyltransferase n=1 Tax=Robiginitalea sp. SC105 TaxID=2762332 RepID=UPI00163AF0E4|nr:GNAT family N-acetyltransferase [Robiginitalea sp. SC105]MBC2840779.1 GNAT family N-acetyltransferase [Robiginitalea sp. SC105]
MNKEALQIRRIQPGDDAQLAALIREVLPGTGAPCEGTALADPSLDRMFLTYQRPDSAFWVVADQEQVWGGGGIAPLQGGDAGTCELQKMYFREELRGMGYGRALLKLALETARELGYTSCYLETMPYMEAALALYRSYGFADLERPVGCTGHTACQVWMRKTL